MDFNVCSPLRVSKNCYFDVFAPEASRAKKYIKNVTVVVYIVYSADQRNKKTVVRRIKILLNL